MASFRPNGSASLHVAKVRERSTVLSSWARSPITLLTPRNSGESVWAYTSSFGGGMVAGDETSLNVRIDAGARCLLSTQASTKIYRNPALRPCSHRLQAQLHSGSLLVLAPDAVQCFAGSSYEQFQTFDLAVDASLVLVDWLSSGRAARGERWAFRHYSSKNQIRRAGELLLHDSLLLDVESGALGNQFRTGRFNSLATVVLIGPSLAQYTAEILATIHEFPVKRGAGLVLSASPLREGAILRFAGTDLEQVGRAIHEQLRFLPAILQGDPWSRKW
jgi:urease accessory protein